MVNLCDILVDSLSLLRSERESTRISQRFTISHLSFSSLKKQHQHEVKHQVNDQKNPSYRARN